MISVFARRSEYSFEASDENDAVSGIQLESDSYSDLDYDHVNNSKRLASEEK